MTRLPLFNYPTTIAWIDDDDLFLRAATKTFGSARTIKCFNNPLECLHFFKGYQPFLSKQAFFNGCTDHESYDLNEHLPIDLNTKLLSTISLKPERHEEISLLIVDFHMPQMDGLSLCRQLQGLPIKKILLTGEVDHPKAVEAFNEGIIDRFIRKDSPQLIHEIQQHIKTLSQQFFNDYSRGLLSHLEVDHPLPISDP